MNDRLPLMIFTDLDGTLLDHDTYRYDAATQALDALRARKAAVVLASSKTAAEIATLRADLGLERWPAIVENGAGLLPPSAQDVEDRSEYQAIRAALDILPAALRRQFRGFGDMSAAEVSEMTGLSLADARQAKQRAFSEPGHWAGTAQAQADLLDHLAPQGITGQQGGRYLSLSFGRNKADRVRDLIKAYAPLRSIALGDAPNDIEMLTQADFGVVVANPHRSPLPRLEGETEGRILRTEAAGPEGWNLAVLALLERLNL